MTPTKVEFDKAVEDFHRAAGIEKTAEKLRAAARQVILDYWAVNMDEFSPEGEDGKTMTTGKGGVSITVPVKKGLPARFDDERTDECFRILEDIDPKAAEALFPAFRRFAGPQSVIDYCKHKPWSAKTIAGILLPYTLPATQDESMTPRVTPVKSKLD
jgi:hypothetical protein